MARSCKEQRRSQDGRSIAFHSAWSGNFNDLPCISRNPAPIDDIAIRAISCRFESDRVVDRPARHPMQFEAADKLHFAGILRIRTAPSFDCADRSSFIQPRCGGMHTIDVILREPRPTQQGRRYCLSQDGVRMRHYHQPEGGKQQADLGSGIEWGHMVSLVAGRRYPPRVAGIMLAYRDQGNMLGQNR